MSGITPVFTGLADALPAMAGPEWFKEVKLGSGNKLPGRFAPERFSISISNFNADAVLGAGSRPALSTCWAPVQGTVCCVGAGIGGI